VVDYVLFASATPFAWIAFECPVVMLLLLLKVTGIPATEARRAEHEATSTANISGSPASSCHGRDERQAQAAES